MDTELYLDTARLGRMCPTAREAERDFLALVSQLGSSLYFEWFLQHGWNSLPPRLIRRVPALRCWDGVAELKQGIARFLNQPPDCSTYFFGQSDALIHFAADALTRKARSILTTDLEWPAYLDHLRAMAKRRGRSIHVVPLRRMIFQSGATATDVRELLLDTALANACDGAFVSDITYLGIRLPIEEICSGLRAASA
ncbi:MAG: hypothetical protein KDA92_17495, partial [Planctomycetales bacterium]|nr:hypothetical protein [Planctomycetales bacterium]